MRYFLLNESKYIIPKENYTINFILRSDKKIYLVEYLKELDIYFTLTLTIDKENKTKDISICKSMPHSVFRKINRQHTDVEELTEIEVLVLLSEYKKQIEDYLERFHSLNEEYEKAKDYFLNYINDILGDEQ